MRNRQEETLMNRINEASFAMDDVVLYLDTHPDDRNALNFFHHVKAMRQEAMKAYEEQFGPLTPEGVQSTTQWTWMTDRWPWEREA